ncbi:U-box domain-containing protein 6-like [Cynara cardunculus var. scolymus]|uniref:Armadillo n=1 Tax=Cynara cardunculus var. scolymus TaxID=59895 RepID=A0A103XQN7_CYNCS|nr:U-box domain-containing protein 6-like [Cynara cardunculus var. scolymus]KVH95102.1 Armadillo [Cynara cardunculus var. scolymus]
MAEFQQNHRRSLVLDHPTPTTVDGDAHFKLWSSCRRKIIDAMRCTGGISRYRKTVKSPVAKNHKLEEMKTSTAECRSDTNKNNGNHEVSEKLPELMKMPELSSLVDVRLKEVVKRLQCGGDGDALGGAREVRELAKDDSEARTNLALLGAIPPLVAMLDSDHLDSQISALYALLNLGIGNDLNKSAITESGAVHKMLDLVESPNEGLPNPDLSAAIVANFLGLSALDSNKPIIGSSGAISFLIKTLKTNTNSQVIQDSLRALYNLSILPSNVLPMIEINDFLSFLLTMMGGTESSDRILSILSNVVSTPEGQTAVGTVTDAFPILIDVLSWMDSPNCQEKATYILMVMAHKSYGHRQALVEAGIMSSLLELTLFGSTLAQKRSSRILEILRINKGKEASKTYGGGVSAPLYGSVDAESTDPSNCSSKSSAVRHLVELSLQNNMRRIVKRANLPQDFVPSEHLKKSVASFSTSKSLPF